jgi:D-hexose-6-phosphate mutarotase
VDVTFRLDPKSFPPEFPVVNVEYNVTLNDKSLTTALKTSNPQESATAIRFKMFYHNYLAVSHVQNARVSGLSEGTEYKDTVKGGELGKWGGGDISFAEKTGK